MPRLLELIEQQNESDLVSIGFGHDAYFLPKEVIVGLFNKLRQAGIKLFTSHDVQNNLVGCQGPSITKLLDSYRLLKPDVLLSHSTGASDEDFELLKEAGAHVCATPGTEAQMAHGELVAFRDDVLGCFGIDCKAFSFTRFPFKAPKR